MYTLYKILDGERTVIGYVNSPTEGALAIDADIQEFKDNANYELIRDNTQEG